MNEAPKINSYEDMKQVGIHLPTKMIDQLQALSKQLGLPHRNDLIRWVLATWTASHSEGGM